MNWNKLILLKTKNSTFELEIKKKKITPSRNGTRPSTRENEGAKDSALGKKSKNKNIVHRLNFSQTQKIIGLQPLEILGLFKEALGFNEETQQPIIKLKEVIESVQLNTPKGVVQYPECAQSHIKFNESVELFLNIK